MGLIRDSIRLYFEPLTQITAFWKETWASSKKLFFAEMFGVLLGMAAATMIGVQSPNPDLQTIFILYNLSAFCLIYSNYLRKSAWMIVLMTFYVGTNTIGLMQAI